MLNLGAIQSLFVDKQSSFYFDFDGCYDYCTSFTLIKLKVASLVYGT